jgi:hypothetical protein
MKNRFSSIAALALSIFSFTLNAENVERNFTVEGTNIKITAIENAKTVVVTLNNTATGEMSVVLEDASGTDLTTDKVKSSAYFAKRYNLSQLEAGNYRLVVTKNAITTIQPFELTAKNVVLNELDRKEKFLPTVTLKNGKLDVNVLLGNYSNINVKVSNNEGTPIFADKNYVVFTLNKRYDMTKLPSGTYIVEVLAGDATEYFTVKL